MNFTALRTLANLLITFGYIFLVGGILLGMILYTKDYGALLSAGVFFGGVTGGIALLVNGEHLQLQIEICDQLTEHTRLLKRIVNLNLPGK